MGVTEAVLGVRQWSDRQSGLDHSDELLVAGVRAGDPAAFEEIYDLYARGILAFCVHMLGSREAAEDALQLTFVAAYRALRGGDSSIALRPWLYTIARNRCLSELRARREAVMVELIGDAPVIDGLADQVQRREDLREMVDDMQRLPADQRAALVLFELGDHPQKEIATVLGVRTEKVKALVFQAREALVRGRAAREHPCRDIREQLATLEGRIPTRSVLRAHIERCPGCQSFEHDVRHQRAALALILPVALTGELKRWILGSSLHSGGAVAAGVGACGGGGVAASACGGGALAGGGAVVGSGAVAGSGAVVGGATVVSGMGGAGAISAATAGGIAGTGAIATSAPIVAAAAGLTAVGESVGGLSATGVMAKILTAAAIATVAASSSHNDKLLPHAGPATAKAHHRQPASAVPLKATHRAARPGGTATGVPPTVTATPLGSPAEPPSSTPATSAGATSSATSGPSTTAGTGAMTPPTAAGAPGNGAASNPSAIGATPTSGGTSTTASAPSDPGSATTTPPSSGASSTNVGAGSGTAASTNPTSSPTSDQTTTTTSTSAPPAGETSGTDGSASSPSTTATDGTGASTDTTSAAGDTAPAASPATAPSTSTAAAPLSAAAASGGDAATSASSATTSGS
jgi:RNA polymerase sigma factor (sigma-70 family)